jgi:uncharacterized protein YndB with AHSA1/START domain
MSGDDLCLTHIPPVKVGMFVRRPPDQVFEALVDPAVTTKFWFTKSTGKLVPGANVRWDWGDDDGFTTVEFLFTPWEGDATHVEVTEAGLSGDGDAVAARLAGSTGGFSLALSVLKAFLEHDVVLAVVADRFPKGLEHGGG